MQTKRVSSFSSSSRLVVFGATGGTGRALVRSALARDHEVTVFVRRPERLDPETRQHPRLTIARGDVTNAADVRDAIRKGDVVVSALGTSAFSRTQLRRIGTQNIVDAMEAAGASRFVSLSVLGAGASWDDLPFHIKHIIVPLYLKRAFADHNAQEAVIRQSSLSWVIVRPPFLTDDRATDRYQHGDASEFTSPRMKVSRTDVANFMLEQVDGDAYLHSAPAISY